MNEVKVVAVATQAPLKQELGTATSQDQGDIPQYALEDIMEAFEKDPSKYPLKEAKTVEGITFRLSGLERKDKMFVLKAAIDNETGSDFFVKDFKIRSSGRILASQSLFRIIVESHSLREGYVLFENPEAGARVDIELREDGGNGRSINLPIVYQF